MTVVVAHPVAAKVDPGIYGVTFTGYDPSVRDSQIRAIRAALDRQDVREGPALILGDFNITDREPGYAHWHRVSRTRIAQWGLGPGSTWRPEQVEWLPFGLLRIDMLFTRGKVRPLSIAPDCTPRGSDHCILRANVEIYH